MMENVCGLRRASEPILAGTEGPSHTMANRLSLHWELESLVEALRAATSLVAEMHRLPDRGVIVSGMRANLVLLDADLLVNISNTQKIAMIMVGGC